MGNNDYEIGKRNKTDILVKILLFIYLFPLFVFSIIGGFDLKVIIFLLSALLGFVATLDLVISTIRLGWINLPLKSNISIMLRRYFYISSKFFPLIFILIIYVDQKYAEDNFTFIVIIFLVYQIISYTLFRKIKSKFGIDPRYWSIRYSIERNKIHSSNNLLLSSEDIMKLITEIEEDEEFDQIDMLTDLLNDSNAVFALHNIMKNHEFKKLAKNSQNELFDWNELFLGIITDYQHDEEILRRLTKSMIYTIIGDYENADKILSELISEGINNKFILWLKGNCLMKLKQYEEAKLCYFELLRSVKTDHMIWYNLGSAHYQLGNFADAKNCFSKSIELKNDVLYSWAGKGTCEIKLKQYKDAINTYDDAMKLNVTSKVIWHGKGIAHQMINENSIAIDCFEKALAIDPTFERSIKRRNELLDQ